MPSFETAEPLALDLHGKGLCEIPSFPSPVPIPCIFPVVMTVGARGFTPFPIFNANILTSARVCLGDRAFGRDVTIGVFPGSCTSIVKSIAMDRVDIVPDASCPAPGQVPNGDFEAIGGWTVGGTGAEVAPAVGNNNTRGGRIHSTMRCQTSSLSGAISVRMSQPARPALTFTVNGTLGKRMVLTSGFTTLASYTGKSVYEKVSICLPEHLKGMASTLSFGVANDTTGGPCGDPDDVEFVFDDIAIESDPTCDPETFVIDGGFERTDTARYWSTSIDGGTVSFARGAGANTGVGHAVVTQSTCDKVSRFYANVTSPEPSPGNGGPAIEFFYKATTATAITYDSPAGALTPTATWTRARQCLDPRRTGTSSTVDFRVTAAASCTAGTLSIDDIRAVHDPTCPE
jgi:hypothetical protein